jgi:hypothetical protein
VRAGVLRFSRFRRCNVRRLICSRRERITAVDNAPSRSPRSAAGCCFGCQRTSTSIDRRVIGYDVGGGVNGFFTAHVGIRGDVRHFQTFQDVNVLLVNGKLGFWRASLGLALKF